MENGLSIQIQGLSILILQPAASQDFGSPRSSLKSVRLKPLGEPVARHGPFVMNTMAEIRQAAEDYLAGKF